MQHFWEKHKGMPARKPLPSHKPSPSRKPLPGSDVRPTVSDPNPSPLDDEKVRKPAPGLPTNAIMEIMVNLPDLESLKSFLKASPDALRVFQADQGAVCQKILIKHIGHNLPIAVARHEAAKAKWKPRKPLSTKADRDAASHKFNVEDFCDAHLSKQGTELSVLASYFTLETAVELWSFHNTVLKFVDGFLAYIEDKYDNASTNWQAEMPAYPWSRHDFYEVEKSRLGKMLYVTEIVSILIPVEYAHPKSPDRSGDWKAFWSWFAPWEFLGYVEMQSVLKDFARNGTYFES